MADKKRGRKKILDELPSGTILTDISKVQWQIVEPIGQGGFGVIYSAKKVCPLSSGAIYVAKVEPHTNGPLFVEKNFFMRNLQPKMIDEFKRTKKMTFLGLPQYLGGGTHLQNNVQHRFLIMERFGENINTQMFANSGVDYKLLGKYCCQIVDSLMFIHEKGYAHMDVKPENLLLKYRGAKDEVYLIDFGIIDRCTTDKDFIPDKKKQHNGTTLYTSRDSHQGVVTKRGDLEILGYNILQWCGLELPWSKDVKTPAVVLEKKHNFISNIRKELVGKIPEPVVDYFVYISSLKHNDTPDYDRIKCILLDIGSKGAGVAPKTKSCYRKNISSPKQRLCRKDESDVALGVKNGVASLRKRPAITSSEKNDFASRKKSTFGKSTSKISGLKSDAPLKPESKIVITPPRRKGRSAENI